MPCHTLPSHSWICLRSISSYNAVFPAGSSEVRFGGVCANVTCSFCFRHARRASFPAVRGNETPVVPCEATRSSSTSRVPGKLISARNLCTSVYDLERTMEGKVLVCQCEANVQTCFPGKVKIKVCSQNFGLVCEPPKWILGRNRYAAAVEQCVALCRQNKTWGASEAPWIRQTGESDTP